VSERRSLLAAHPYFELYKIAKRRSGVPWFLVASVITRRQASARRARLAHWRRFRNRGIYAGLATGRMPIVSVKRSRP
jgi:hypothetical protein